MPERAFELTVELGGYDKNKEQDIIKACLVEWNFREEDFLHHLAIDGKSDILEASAVGILYEDEDKNEFAKRFSRAVWRANGTLCHVEVRVMGITSMRCQILGWRDDERQLEVA